MIQVQKYSKFVTLLFEILALTAAKLMSFAIQRGT
jgi:hypothetical protein